MSTRWPSLLAGKIGARRRRCWSQRRRGVAQIARRSLVPRALRAPLWNALALRLLADRTMRSRSSCASKPERPSVSFLALDEPCGACSAPRTLHRGQTPHWGQTPSWSLTPSSH